MAGGWGWGVRGWGRGGCDAGVGGGGRWPRVFVVFNFPSQMLMAVGGFGKVLKIPGL
jgi:hypothetical protein